MRTIVLPLLLLASATPALAQQHGGHHGQHGGHGADHAHHEGHHQPGVIPEGWQVRLDRENARMEQVQFMAHDGYVHLILGPSGIFWREEDTARGAYTASASFTQNRQPAHMESYGLLVGGQALDGPDQDYLYFLVRGDGSYLVKHRAGTETHTLVPWSPHPAVRAADAEGRATNVLSIRTTPAGVSFLVNDTEVTSLPASPHLNTDGIVGLRVNHNLDVHVRDFAVTPGA